MLFWRGETRSRHSVDFCHLCCLSYTLSKHLHCFNMKVSLTFFKIIIHRSTVALTLLVSTTGCGFSLQLWLNFFLMSNQKKTEPLNRSRFERERKKKKMGFNILPAPQDDSKQWREKDDHESQPDDVHDADIHCGWRTCWFTQTCGATCLSMCT